ncbi:MAG: LysR family transcriptional regulator [Clostridia bacterium]|nr:LysR family transcriptional regulator [Clostridia bacterium]
MEIANKYAYEVYRKESFTKAAESLYISQPSLSAAISRLEKELGFRIFDRSTIPCSLTAEGRIYIECIEEIAESENNMRKRIRELSDIDHGSIIVGGSSYASYLIMSEICGQFYKTNPKITVTLDIGNVGSPQVLWEKLDTNEIDIIISYYNQHNKCVMEPLLEERLVIAMHKKMKGAKKLQHFAMTRKEFLTKTYSSDREIEDMSIFSNIEFLDFSHKSDIGQRMAKLLGDYKSSHYKIQNARHSEMHYNLMRAGIGAVVTSTLAVQQKIHEDDSILFFVPKSEESYRKIFLAYNPSSKNNPLIKSFIKIAKETYAKNKRQ